MSNRSIIAESHVLVAENAVDQAELASSLLIAHARSTLLAKDHFDFVLSGGSTPVLLFRYLAARCRAAIDWDRVRFFWGDERDVPPDHPESNFRMANETLLKPLGIHEEMKFRIPTGIMGAKEAAQQYERTLRGIYETTPAFDYALMGLGSDGHTASLFPDAKDGWAPADEAGMWVAAPWVPHLSSYRVTLLPNALNQAIKVCFLVSGAQKAQILAKVLHFEGGTEQYPAQLIHARAGKALWIADRAAVSHAAIRAA